MLNTLGAEGGRFVARQTEVNQPTLNTVGNITDTIGRKVIVLKLKLKERGGRECFVGFKFVLDICFIVYQVFIEESRSRSFIY